MNSSLYKIIKFLIVLICMIFFSAVVCFILDYQLFSISNFGFQLLIFALLTTFISFGSYYLKLLENLILAVFWGFVLAYFLKKTSVMIDFRNFYLLLFYTELLTISYSFIYLGFRKMTKVYLRGLLFSIVTAVDYAFIHVILHQVLQLTLSGRQLLFYFSNGLVITLTMSFAAKIADQINGAIQKNLFSISN